MFTVQESKQSYVEVNLKKKRKALNRNFSKFICFDRKETCLTVGLGNSLQLVLLLDGVRVR